MDRTQKIIVILLSLLLIAVIAAAAVLGGRGGFTPPDFDDSAVRGEPGEVDPSSAYGTLNFTEDISVSMCGEIAVNDGMATVWFASHTDNTVWMRMEVYDADGTLLGTSGVIRAGEYVERIVLFALPKSSEGTAKIITYEPQTYYSRGVFTVRVGLNVN